MTVRNSASLSDRLLCLLKSGDSFHDCFVLKCRDSNERKVHRTVLMASSPYFMSLLQENPTLQSVDLPYTSDAADIMIEYLYSSDEITFTKKQAIQLYCLARMFAVETLTQQLETFFCNSMDDVLRDDAFMVHDTPEDVSQMKKIFEKTNCDALLLVARILRWEKVKKPSADMIVDLLHSVVDNSSDSKSPKEPTALFSFGAAALSGRTPFSERMTFFGNPSVTPPLSFSTPLPSTSSGIPSSNLFGKPSPPIGSLMDERSPSDERRVIAAKKRVSALAAKDPVKGNGAVSSQVRT